MRSPNPNPAGIWIQISHLRSGLRVILGLLSCLCGRFRRAHFHIITVVLFELDLQRALDHMDLQRARSCYICIYQILSRVEGEHNQRHQGVLWDLSRSWTDDHVRHRDIRVQVVNLQGAHGPPCIYAHAMQLYLQDQKQKTIKKRGK